ncbi:hypothetical protein V2J09_009091 [Rumex salicifolius]
MFLRGLIKHLNSGDGIPLRKDGALQAYVYEFFDNMATMEMTWPLPRGAGDLWDPLLGLDYAGSLLTFLVQYTSGVTSECGSLADLKIEEA